MKNWINSIPAAGACEELSEASVFLECKNEVLEQYGRRCYLRIEGVPSAQNESSDDALGKVKSLIAESRCEIPDVVIDRVH